MSNSGKQSPLGANSLSSLLANTGININPIMVNDYGSSTSDATYTFGAIVNDTCLKYLTYAINDAYTRGQVSTTVYDTLITIGADTIPALGNSPANIFYDYTGYPEWAVDYDNTSAVTQWGFARLFALQGYNEFNYNNGLPNYAEYLGAFMTASSFINTTNKAIMSMQNSLTFLDGTFSNLDDLITADVTGVSLATVQFGKDLISLGKAFDLQSLATFGLPTNVIKLLRKYNAITTDVSLALISSGLEVNWLNDLLVNSTVIPTANQQKMVFSALQLVVGDSLAEILVILNCKTAGLESLADLLNVKKLFPNSYSTLTVPLYNTTQTQNNSKTYYPIFVDGAVNINLSAPAVVDQVGSQIPVGAPEPEVDMNTGIIQAIPEGFGSFLYSILPKDIAISCGALSTSLLQIKNISSVPFEKFAQIVFSLETMQGLNTNSSSVPTDTELVSSQLSLLALGTGPYGSYTMSDFFGCMSGLPYVGRSIARLITSTQSIALTNIYKDLYLSTQWEAATITVNYTTYTSGSTYYKITGVTITDPGGGYGRGGAAAPTITISGGSGATAVATIGTDSSNLGTNGSGTYGRVIGVVLTSPGSDTTTLPTVTIQAPPVTSGTNTASGTAGWPAMNIEVGTYITRANAEIKNILENKYALANSLNTMWSSISKQLTSEQRAISKGLPLAVPYTGDLQVTATSPTAQITFVDSIPQFAMDTDPNMLAQTLEAISNICTTGGSSMIGMMRETRNQARLSTLGIELDNNILDGFTEEEQKELLGNGSIPGTTSAPAALKQVECPTAKEVAPQSAGFYDPTTNNFVTTNPNYGEADQPVDTGDTNVPGSFAGSEYAELLPPNLNVFYTSNTLLPATYNIPEAIDQVITCNCDCWELI